MKILFDHCVPKPFKRELTGQFVKTAFQMGWADLDNGILLAAAAEHFDVLLTIDQNIKFQHNLAKLPIAVIILVVADNEPDTLRPYASYVLNVLPTLQTPTMICIYGDGRVEQMASKA